MPPKAKGEKKSKKDGGEATEDAGPIEPSQKELELQTELDDLQVKLDFLKLEVEKLRKENSFLQQEATQTRTESHEYMSYVAKKTQKRQNAIITLSDQNQHELRKISLEKEEMLKNFQDRKDELKKVLLDKEERLAKATLEFGDLQDYQDLREEQLGRIEKLEQQIAAKRAEYSDELTRLNTDFLAQRKKYSADAEEKLQKLSQEAKKRAVACLEDHANQKKEENTHLRVELAELLKRSRLLNDHKQRLEKQNSELLREQQYSMDILRLRGERHRKATDKKITAINKSTREQSHNKRSDDPV